ncbi:MAG: AI-2E family transporter [Desulfuromonas sp.]|nr:MAG: AI-2E family transporter [Desulfuromonas sp.]
MSIPPKAKVNRNQALLFYLTLTAGIATGLIVYSSATTIVTLLRTATTALFIPLLVSLVLTFLLEPPVTFLERKTGRRTLSIFIVYTLLGLLIYLFMIWMIPNSKAAWQSLQADLPRYLGRLTEYFKELVDKLHNEFPVVATYDLPARGRAMAEQVLGGILISTPKSALGIGGILLIVPLFTFFFLRDGSRIVRTCLSFIPNRTFEMVHDMTYLIIMQLSYFVRGRIIEAAIIGCVVYAGLSLTDIRYAFFLAVFAAITNLIPYIGPLIGMVPGVLIALIDLGFGGQFWWIVITYFIIAQVIVDNFILIPILISRFSNLHPLWVITSIIIGGKLFGVIGMIIGVPIVSIIKITFTEIRHYRRTFSLIETTLEAEQS